MALETGTRLGEYEILSPLGAGGMGEVYRALDTKLGREVAIKLLLADVSANPNRLARFEREARVLASLNHPNIATLHGFETGGESAFLVMELVEGETMADRIARGAIPGDEAVGLFLQIAQGLEATHEKGVIHRDLKPANIKISEEGEVKILDFGLAKAPAREEGHSEGPSSSQSPTLAQAATQQGIVLGSTPYMSPEQARGRSIDRRTDIWAFGCCLYQALAGRRPFDGEDASVVLAAILKSEPDWQALPSETPWLVRRLLQRCLEKHPRRRYQHIGDARLDLEESVELSDMAPSFAAEAGGGALRVPVARPFRLTAEICRDLDREMLDPRVIGDDVHYLDNDRSSEVLVCYLPGLGLDHRIFAETLERSPFRGVAMTYYGCEPVSSRRIAMTLSDQLIVLRHFLEDAVERLQPGIVVIAGFSLGADAALRLLAETRPAPRRVDGILSLGCNLNLETCVFSSRLANVASAEPADVLPVLQDVASSVSTLDEWVQAHRYLVEVVRKYRDDFAVLRTASKATLEPFLDPTRQTFAEWYRCATERGTKLRCVFTDTDIEQEALRQLKLDHLDHDVLGADFDDEDLYTEKDCNHFDLLDSGVVQRHLEWLVEQIRGRQ